MKIAVIVHVPASKGGGGFYAMKTQSELLIKYGFEIHIYEPYSLHHPNSNAKILYHDYKSRLLGFFENIGKPGIFPLFLNVHLEENYDYIYTFSPFYLLFILFNRKYLRKTKKIVISTKDLLFPEKKLKSILRYLTIIFYRILKLNNLYLYNENGIESLMFKNLNIKMYEVPPLVNLNIDVKNFCFEKNEKFTILFLGSVEKRKGAEMLFLILENFKNSNIIFNIAGGIHNDYKERVKDFKAENITFMGNVDEKTKDNLLFNSDLGLMLSLEESFSIVTREMLLHGLPVLTTWKPAIDIFGNSGITVISDLRSICKEIRSREREYSNSYESYIESRRGILLKYNKIFDKVELEKKFLNIFDL